MTRSAWDPARYGRFGEERRQPFHDLLALLQPVPGGRVVDLGCGTGELTALLHGALGARETLGLDQAPTMLAESARFAAPGLRFALADIADFAPEQPFDVVFSNAALQWLPDHPRLFPRLRRLVAPGGQLAVQMPANHDHPSHRLAEAVAGEAPFREALGGQVRRSPVLAPEDYALLLASLGFPRPQVRLQVYLHRLDARDEVVEWVRGTLLTWYEARLGPALYAQYLARYRSALAAALPDERPFLYPFKRLHLWGRLG